jgi:NAD(P)-dependent dehydrogenase (short-subunit alcohol dehydrogenase family)
MSEILRNKTAIITGSSEGLGLEIAKKFVQSGANVVLCARNAQALMDAKKSLTFLSHSGQRVISAVCDVSVEQDVLSLVGMTIEAFGSCHILVNNAGIYGPKGPVEQVVWADWLKTIQINIYGSVMMARSVIPHMKKQGYGKIIQLSGGGATNPLPLISAYAVSKAAIVRFAETLAEELRDSGIDVNALAPGPLNTKMLDEILEAGPGKVGQSNYDKALIQRNSGGAPIHNATELALFLASSESNGITGKLISALWDNWREWPQYINELNNSDVFTLRRICGRDRGLPWGDM